MIEEREVIQARMVVQRCLGKSVAGTMQLTSINNREAFASPTLW